MIAALHGYLAGGGVALALTASYKVCEYTAQMEQGNLVRGVVPIAEFSQTLWWGASLTTANRIYLGHEVMNASTALQLGHVNELCEGVASTKSRGYAVASLAACLPSYYSYLAVLPNDRFVAEEAFGHAECREVQGNNEAVASMTATVDAPQCTFAWRTPSGAYDALPALTSLPGKLGGIAHWSSFSAP